MLCHEGNFLRIANLHATVIRKGLKSYFLSFMLSNVSATVATITKTIFHIGRIVLRLYNCRSKTYYCLIFLLRDCLSTTFLSIIDGAAASLVVFREQRYGSFTSPSNEKAMK